MGAISKGWLVCVVFWAGLSLECGAQNTALEVYKVFQTHCTFSSCHNNATPSLGLDLQGSGPDSIMQVFENLINVRPNIAYADNQGYKLVSPGDPAQSFLFHKINNGLDPTLDFHIDAGEPMPLVGGPMDETEIELIRQWILGGAYTDDREIIDLSVIDDFYNNNGVQSVPNPPLPPDESEGFQIHLGPFFIPPAGEDEVFLKFDPHLQEDQEITKVEVFMGDESHHFILYRFFSEDEELCGGLGGDVGPDDFPAGFRDVDQASHFNANFQFGAQNTEVVDLPYGTAFAWDAGAILDLNSHYINFNQNQVLASEVFINVYTQPAGTAAQEMEAIMIPNLSLDIPNNGEEITFSEIIQVAWCFQQGMYVWATTCHTHQLGQDYDIYVTDAGGNDIDHFYDGSCFTDGVPGCDTEFYDYQHPPTRVFDDYHFLSNQQGIRHEATYVNNGPEDVGWGLTSEDEMMLFFLFYVFDTTGLTPPIPNAGPNAMDDTSSTDENSSVIVQILDNDSDSDGVLDASSVIVISGPSNGMTTVNGDGSITYDPDNGYSGSDTFTYIVCDDGDPVICDTAIVVVQVVALPNGVFYETFKPLTTYPNPSTGLVKVNAKGAEINSAVLLDLQGQHLGKFNLQSADNEQVIIDLTTLNVSNGVYWILFQNEGKDVAISQFILVSD